MSLIFLWIWSAELATCQDVRIHCRSDRPILQTQKCTPQVKTDRLRINRRYRQGRPLSKMPSPWRCAGFSIATLVVVATCVTISVVALTNDSSSGDSGPSSPDLDTPVGIFKGKVSSSVITGRSYVAFKGIPFAEPPVGDLRFARPVPAPETVQGQVVNGKAMTQSCWSTTKSPPSKYYGEDCLYINVYAPYGDDGPVNSGPRLPVMVWLHGGGFVAGSVYPEPIQLVTRGQAIVVMVNYRLGVFGFLTTLSDELPSNNGLWDQYLAIKWVSENIRHFFGDDSAITVFGQSAGATSTSLHVISPISSPFFDKAIIQSSLTGTSIARDPEQSAYDFGDLVGCGGFTGSIEFATCLRNVSVADILANDKADSLNITLAQKQITFIWTPVIDGEMVVDDPMHLYSNKSFLAEVGAFEKDFMIGILNDDGGIIVDNFLYPIMISDITDVEFFNDLVQTFISSEYGNLSAAKSSLLRKTIYQFYIGDENPRSPINSQSVLDFATDAAFFIPATQMALSVSECSKSYNLSCQSGATPPNINNENCPQDQTPSKTFFYLLDTCPPSDPCRAPCAVHGAEVALAFPRASFSDPEQQKLSDQFVDLLVAFARSSNPGEVVSCEWPEFEPVSQSYLSLNPSASVRTFLYGPRSTFWLKQIPQLLQ